MTTSPSITLYYSPGACSLAPHILLRESGLEFEAITRTEGQTYTTFAASLARINPKKQIPILVLDEEVITENIAIITAIAGLCSSKVKLMGNTPVDLYRVYEWLSYLSSSLHSSAFKSVARPERFSDDVAALEGIKAKGLKSMEACYEYIEGRLEGTHAVGGCFTVVDPYLLVFYRWGRQVGFSMGEKWPKYTALVEELVKRDAVKETLKVEGIEWTE